MMKTTPGEQVSGQRARTAARVDEAIRQLLDEGKRIPYYTVAERAQVARSTLYRREDLGKMVDEAREYAKRMPPSNKLTSLQCEVERLDEKVGTLSSRIPGNTYHFVSF